VLAAPGLAQERHSATYAEMMKGPQLTVVAGSAALLAIILVVVMHSAREAEKLPRSADSVEPHSLSAGAIATESMSRVVPEATPPSAPRVAVAASRTSNDYLALIRIDLDDAQGGNAAAMFRISEALRYCQSGYRVYFVRPGRRITLDEAMASAAPYTAVTVEELTDIHDRCASLIDSDMSAIGTADEWLDRAVAAGEARAQLQKASRLLAELAAVAAKQAGHPSTPLKIDKADPRFSKAQELIVTAAKKDAGGALWTVGENSLILLGDAEKSEKIRWAMSLAACKRGFDCSQNASWYKVYCRGDLNCQPDEMGGDLIKRIAADYPDIDYLSDRAIAKLDASKFDDLLTGKLE